VQNCFRERGETKRREESEKEKFVEPCCQLILRYGLNVKSHPFCLKMLLFVWVTCRWSRLAVDCCCEYCVLRCSDT